MLSGLPGRPQRAAYATPEAYRADLTRWNSAARRVQRARETKPRGGTQTRGGTRPAPLSAAQRAAWRLRAIADRDAAMRRRGARMRLHGTIAVGSSGTSLDVRERSMPSGGTGQFITRSVMASVLTDYNDGEIDAAADTLLTAFCEGYGLAPDLLEVERMEWLRLWPEGTREPR